MPAEVEIHDVAPDFEIERNEETGDVVLTIRTTELKLSINVGNAFSNAEELHEALDDVTSNLQVDIIDGWADTPGDEDGYVSEGSPGYFVQLSAKDHGGFASRDIAVYELAKAMAEAGYFPNCWYVNERGDTDDIGKDVRAFHDESGDKMKPLEGVAYEEGETVLYDGVYWTVEKDYGQLGVVLYVSGDPSMREHVTDRSEVTPDDDEED